MICLLLTSESMGYSSDFYTDRQLFYKKAAESASKKAGEIPLFDAFCRRFHAAPYSVASDAASVGLVPIVSVITDS